MASGQWKSWLQQLRDALFLDLPWVLDSAMRHSDFNANTRYVLAPTEPPGSYKWQWRAPVRIAVSLAAVLLFALYGPTFHALCSVFPPPLTLYALVGAALALAWLTFAWWQRLVAGAGEHYQSRLERLAKQGIAPTRPRRLLLCAALLLLALTPVIPLLTIISSVVVAVFDPETQLCMNVTFDSSALWQMLAALALIAAALLARHLPRWLLWTPACLALSLIAWALLWWLAPPQNTEAAHLPYRTGFALLALLLFAVVFPARLGAKWALRSLAAQTIDAKTTFTQALACALTRCELFVKREDPQFGWTRVWYALFSAPLLHPLLLLLVPSYAALIAMHDDLYWWFGVTLALAWLLITMGSVSSRWNQQIVLVRRWLLSGLPLGVSVAVIVLALCRLAGIEYVSYVMDAASFGALTMGVLMCYALAWALEGCVHRPIQVELLALLAQTPKVAADVLDLKEGRVPYAIDPNWVTADVNAADRWLQPHGDGRFAVVGRLADPAKPAFHTYAEYELFERLVASEQRFLASDTHGRLIDRMHELRRRMHIYFTVGNLLIVAVLAAVVWYAMQTDRDLSRQPLARVTVAPAADQPGFDLLQQLTAHADRPALLIAASGGGTRAALFATAAMRALTDAGHANDIRLLSGVSGGGVSLAYFAANRTTLSEVPLNQALWQQYMRVMSYNHIGAVLEGVGEWRLLRQQTLAQLLTESFERQFYPTQQPAVNFGALQDIGLILNTTITGQPYQDSAWLSTLYGIPQVRPADNERAAETQVYSRFAGGRLIFTNLSDASAFPQQGRGRGDVQDFAPDIDLTYKVIRDSSMPITSAAALNANFPPVFANSGVWVYRDAKHQQLEGKYYVTDGGINENRGLISLLYALDAALTQALTSRTNQPLPDMNVVALEASATGFDYRQDRGLSAALSAGAQERLASGLERLLITRLCEHAQQLGGGCAGPGESISGHPLIRVHYLMMPAVFITRGGLGTHWMLPDKVQLTDPRDPDVTSATLQHVELNQQQTRSLIDCLFTTTTADANWQASCGEAMTHVPADWLIDTESCGSTAQPLQCVSGWRSLQAALTN